MRIPLSIVLTVLTAVAPLMCTATVRAESWRAPLDETQLTDEQLAETFDTATELAAIEQAFSGDRPGDGLSRWRDLFMRSRHQLGDRQRNAGDARRYLGVWSAGVCRQALASDASYAADLSTETTAMAAQQYLAAGDAALIDAQLTVGEIAVVKGHFDHAAWMLVIARRIAGGRMVPAAQHRAEALRATLLAERGRVDEALALRATLPGWSAADRIGAGLCRIDHDLANARDLARVDRWDGAAAALSRWRTGTIPQQDTAAQSLLAASIAADIAIAQGDDSNAERLANLTLERSMAWAPETVFAIAAIDQLGRAASMRGATADAEQLTSRAFDMGSSYFSDNTHADQQRRARWLVSARLALHTDRASAALAADALADNVYRIGMASSSAPEARRISAALAAMRGDFGLYLDTRPDDASVNDAQSLFTAMQRIISGGSDRPLIERLARGEAERSNSATVALFRRRDALAQRAIDPAAAIIESPVASDRHSRPIRLDGLDDPLTDLQQVEEQIAELAPDYVFDAAVDPVTIAATQALLTVDEALLLVAPSAHSTHAMLVTRDAVRWHRSPLDRTAVTDRVRRLLFDLGADVDVSAAQVAQWQEQGGRGFPYARSTAFELYGELVAPFEADLVGKRHLFVAASGGLERLPFAALVVAPPQGADGDPQALRSTEWLADRHAVVQLPSAQALHALRRHRTGAQRATRTSFAGFGDPVLEGRAQQRAGGRGVQRGRAPDRSTSSYGAALPTSALADVTALKALARLPGTALELASMRAALGADPASLHLGAAATERTVRSADLSSVAIISFATHGLLAGELDGMSEPGLVFTPPREASADDDGLLTASEIAGLQLDADWVILSACNTAAGDGSAGSPGLSGLAQAFFFAGARTLLASHWPVRDDVAAQLTVRTVEIQRDNPGASRAEAFQRAMREIRNDVSHDSSIDTWAHPNAWAAFTLIGDGAR